ncbi:MAG: amidoligase family protein [Ectothiorhodospiraceae bacterium]
MKTDGMADILPPLQCTEDGSPRRVGVEIELIGLSIETLSALVAEHVGGEVNAVSPYEHRIDGDASGRWQVELDFTFLKKQGRHDEPGATEPIRQAAESLLRLGAEQVVPLEIVSPPLPIARLIGLDELVGRLRQAGARGTASGILYAFGTQLNPELPATGADTIRRYLQAFLCLFDWLKHRARVDLTRRLTTYVDPFPEAYIRRVVDPEYHPDRDGLIDDYLAANPTRNRALDMLPLFLHLDPNRVRAQVADERVKPRPTLHYRLPNSEVDRPGWGVTTPWKDWLQVERLAADPQRLQRLCADYCAFLDRPLSGLMDDWTEHLHSWLETTQAP